MTQLATLIVPFRFGDPDRDSIWTWVRHRYQREHPELEIRVGVIKSNEVWSKGTAVARAYTRATADWVVIADADVVVAPEALLATFRALADGRPWAQPHGQVYRLSPRATRLVLDGAVDPSPRMVSSRSLERRSHPGPIGGGIIAVTRAAYETVGGIDPRFTVWGGEDEAFARALGTLAGPGVRHRYPMWHLWHTQAVRRPGNRASPENEQLAGRYLDAAGDADAMRRIVAEHSLARSA